MRRAQGDKPELPVTFIRRQVNPAKRFLHSRRVVRANAGTVKLAAIPSPFPLLHIRRQQHLIVPMRIAFVVGHHRTHGQPIGQPVSGSLKSLSHDIRLTENLPGQALRQHHMPGSSQCFFRVAGQHRKPQGTHHPGKRIQTAGIKIRFFPPVGINLSVHRHSGQADFRLPFQQAVQLHGHRQNHVRPCISIRIRQTGCIIMLHQIQVLVIRTKVIVVRFRPQPVQAERQAHDAHGQTCGRDSGLPTVAAQIAQGLLQILNPQTYCSHSFKLFPWFHSSHANSSTSP